MNPIVVQVTPPRTPFHLPHLPTMGSRGTKILTVVAAAFICSSMILFAVVSILANNKSFQQSHSIRNIDIPTQSTGTTLSNQANPGGGVAIGAGASSGTNSPDITLTAQPASVTVGQTAVIKWSATKNPTSCTASEDWSGDKDSSGSEITAPLTKVQQYVYTLTCKTKTGTSFRTVGVNVNPKQSAGVSGKAPIVHIGADSSVIQYTSATVTWSSENNPTSCTASGDWDGQQTPSGDYDTGALTEAKQFSYTLTCSNSYGTSAPQTAYVNVTEAPADIPITSLASDPAGTPVKPGGSVTLTWKIVNKATSCTASGDWSGSKNPAGGTEKISNLTIIKTYTFNISCSNSAGSTIDSATIIVLPDPPVVSLTPSPSNMYVGGSSTLTYSSTNNPTSCSASGDWKTTGSKLTTSGNHTESTGTLSTAKTYLYSLSCTNAGGTGYQNNVAVQVTLPPAPAVNISVNPIATTVGNTVTVTYSSTNNPTSCTAGGNGWSGTKSTSSGNHTQSSSTLSTAQTYTFSLSCTNAGGTGSASTSASVTSGGGTTVAPVVTISASPSTIGTGSSASISWSATNSPTSCTPTGNGPGWTSISPGASGTYNTGAINTAGTYTFTLTCSNSAGPGSKSTTLTVIAVPVITISVNPSTITTGSSSTATWTVTNSPTSCTAGGNGWSGTKSTTSPSSQTVGPFSTAGTYTLSLSCTNSGGTSTKSTTLIVNAPSKVYCGGLTPCHGSAYMASHASVGNCYSWNTGSGSAYPWIVNITSYRPSHPGGQKTGSIEETTSICNHDMHSVLIGTTAIPGYKDKGGSTKHNHNSSTNNNTSTSKLSTFQVGFYDAASPN